MEAELGKASRQVVILIKKPFAHTRCERFYHEIILYLLPNFFWQNCS
jgi:hypothetical protein